MEAQATSLNEARVQSYSFRAMLQLALGTAWLVASLLVIPDAISISPNCPDLLTMIVRVIGLWLSAYIQWFLGFLLILKTASIVNRGVIVDGKGLKLSRLSKTISWSNIVGVTSEANPLVSRLLLLDKEALRINIYVRDLKGKVSAKQLDSLLFAKEEFRTLFQVICRQALQISPDGNQVFMADYPFQNKLRSGHKGVERKRRLFVAYISLMLILFMGRTCGRNLFYNEAGIAFNKHDYMQARNLCQQSLWFDSNFAFAWDRMARAEFRLHDLRNAEQHFLKALKGKPDLVSSKVGLSNIYMRQKKFDAARALLIQASRLSPRDIPTMLNLGAFNLQTGKVDEAIQCFDRAIALAPQNTTVKVVSAEAYLKAGRREQAQSLISSVREEEVEHDKKPLYVKLRNSLEKRKMGDG